MSHRIKTCLAANVHALMQRQGFNQATVAKESKGGISQKTLSNLLNNPDTWPTLETICEVAHVLRVEPWQLLVEDFAKHLDYSRPLDLTVRHFLASTDQGKNHINVVAEREYEYALIDRDAPNGATGGNPSGEGRESAV